MQKKPCPGIPRTGGQLGTSYVPIPFFTVEILGGNLVSNRRAFAVKNRRFR